MKDLASWATALLVQRTWKNHGWIPPSKEADVIAKWDYYKSIAMLSEQALEKDKA